MKALALLFLLLAFAMEPATAAGPATEAPLSTPAIQHLVEALKAQLPQGWSIAIEGMPPDKSIRITRNAPTRISVPVINASPGQDNSKIERFHFFIAILPLLPPVDYRRLQAENAQTRQKMSVIYEKLSKSPTVHGIREPVMSNTPFSSDQPEEKARIAKYYDLENSLHELPDGYYEDISMAWTTNIQWSNGPTPEDPAVRSECEAIYKKLSGVPHQY